MEFLGIGPLELVMVVLVALIVLGPKDMVKAGKSIGRFLRTIVSSDTWRVVQQASREMRNLPNRLMREAGIDELEKKLPSQRALSEQMGLDEIKKGLTMTYDKELSSWTTPPPKESAEAENTIAPPGGDAPDPEDSNIAAETEAEDSQDSPQTPNNQPA